MLCPFCKTPDTKVIDSRLVDESNQIRRRRECTECNERFTSYETVEHSFPRIIKRDGITRHDFEEIKLRRGINRALEKRPVQAEEIEKIIARIKHKMITCGEREISSQQIGEWAMDELKNVDQVAYVRFASVYHDFQDVDAFRDEIDQLLKKKKHGKKPTN
jgi:transcriptional repressor NrdR